MIHPFSRQRKGVCVVSYMIYTYHYYLFIDCSSDQVIKNNWFFKRYIFLVKKNRQHQKRKYQPFNKIEITRKECHLLRALLPVHVKLKAVLLQFSAFKVSIWEVKMKMILFAHFLQFWKQFIQLSTTYSYFDAL